MTATNGVAILGIFVADLAFRASRQPEMGETILGSAFKMGPGGKGGPQMGPGPGGPGAPDDNG